MFNKKKQPVRLEKKEDKKIIIDLIALQTIGLFIIIVLIFIIIAIIVGNAENASNYYNYII